jgi:hypothetical protein
MQILHQSTLDHEFFCADRSSKEEQVLIRTFKKQKYEHSEWLKVKIRILFCGGKS